MESKDTADALLTRAQAGDVAAFEALVGLHRDQVFALAYRMTRSEADAAEIAQDTFLAAFRNLAEFRAEAAFGSWLHRITANQALMRLRHKKVVGQVEESMESPTFNDRGSLVDTVADFARDAEGQALDAELSQAITQATDGLPEEYRRVFLLKDVDGLSYEEISQLLQESVPAIKSRLHRARLSLRAAIDGYYAERE
jgi:RNA polymerase sigma-70 factor (ECF subfamily)